MLTKGDVEILKAASLVSLGKHSLHCIIEHKYGQGFLRVELQQNTTGFGFQLGLHHISCDFSGSLFSWPLFTAVVSMEHFFFFLLSD